MNADTGTAPRTYRVSFDNGAEMAHRHRGCLLLYEDAVLALAELKKPALH